MNNINEWNKDEELVLLDGAFPSGCTKTEVKKMLDDLGIKWTIKWNTDGITKIVNNNYWGFVFNHISQYTSSPHTIEALAIRLGEHNITKPKEFKALILNKDNVSMSENSTQIVALLKTMDEANVKLAIALIDNAVIEEDWEPWILINKDVEGMRDLMKRHSISPGQWHVDITKWNFSRAVDEVCYRLRIPDDKRDEFIVEFYKQINR